ncbi:MAG: hypothetical protein EXS36_13505 [Pedosphaera sp.]|nr:hypothetical protein [Pedosphaera sp.]
MSTLFNYVNILYRKYRKAKWRSCWVTTKGQGMPQTARGHHAPAVRTFFWIRTPELVETVTPHPASAATPHRMWGGRGEGPTGVALFPSQQNVSLRYEVS